ncbi:hypothetical protein [Candidatus Uabimicrobium sp. HlEnr_7]|uniref:hypothetical protein n=1 Tax=Candidatus Uabimicrobium helgolandensis TaxID=3095367 RepID=UPI00355736CF
MSLQNSKLVKYTKNTYIFSDRIYINFSDDSRLEGMYLIQVPRHCKKTLIVNAKKKISIFRLIMSKNIDKFSKWQKTNIKVEIQGYSGTHDTVITKKFPAGKIILANYEWVFAPVLIETESPNNISFHFE